MILNNSDEPYCGDVPGGGHLAKAETLTCLLSGDRFSMEKGCLSGPALPERSGAALLAPSR